MVAHACNPPYLGGKEQKDSDLGSAWAKVSKTASQVKSCVYWHMPVLSITWKA
jgi:hypothetical protein